MVDALKKTGQLDNTLIVFTSDNGGERFSDNWPRVGSKMDLTEDATISLGYSVKDMPQCCGPAG